jgi:hypothetical protein
VTGGRDLEANESLVTRSWEVKTPLKTPKENRQDLILVIDQVEDLDCRSRCYRVSRFWGYERERRSIGSRFSESQKLKLSEELSPGLWRVVIWGGPRKELVLTRLFSGFLEFRYHFFEEEGLDAFQYREM